MIKESENPVLVLRQDFQCKFNMQIKHVCCKVVQKTYAKLHFLILNVSNLNLFTFCVFVFFDIDVI